MIFHTDSFFSIGDTHEICQDYALAGTTASGIPYAIVCDGCSGSSGHVDFGARLVANILKLAIEDVGHNAWMTDDVNKMVMHDLRLGIIESMHEYDLAVEDFLVTIEAVFVWKNMAFRIQYGDGVHIADYNTFTYDFTSGAPFYFAYNLNTDKEMYMSQFGMYPVHHEYLGKTDSMTVEEWINCRMWSSYESISNKKIGYTILGVGSDGLKSFSLAEEDCDLEWVVNEVTSIKNFAPGFLRRRMNKFLKMETLAHYDDVGVAMIIVETGVKS
jgi:hypothetical protein